MIKDGIEFTYNVLSIDIESAHMVIEYIPVDSELMPTTLNVFASLTPFYPNNALYGMDSSAGEPEAITLEKIKEYTAMNGAPVGIWKLQKALLNAQ